MFTFTECLRSAIISIRAHGFRSILTTLGIIIGVASVIATISIIQGLSRNISSNFEGLGANGLTIQSYTPLKEQMNGQFSTLTNKDFELINYRIDGISSITPILFSRTNKQVVYRSQAAFCRVLGTRKAYKIVDNSFVKFGRFISNADELTRRRVAVIGEELREKLSLPENPVGKFIKVNSEWVKIIGLMEEKGKLFGFSQDDYVLLPYSTMQSINGNQYDSDIQIQLTIADIDELDNIKQKISTLLRTSRNIKTGEAEDFRIQTSEQLKDSISNILNSITVVMGGIVSISLLVGGIGIMNIMLVSVTERTREIGICKAIGAKRNHILLQFLIESFVLSIFGGLVGLLLGYGLGALIAFLIPGFPPAHVPFWSIALSIGSSAAIGIIFGILPAAKAANLDPIDALRYE